jgi:hypothetical protein
MNITEKIYTETMKHLLELYDEYKEIKPGDLIAEHEHDDWKDDKFIAIGHGSLIEWDKKDCKLMYLFNDFYTSVIYNYDDTLIISELLDTTDDGLGIVAVVSDQSGEVTFKIEIDRIYE